jgi:phosphoribosylglycinamide formyltransferase-1
MMRLAILISGRGSNMLRLADVIDSRTDQAQIVLVAANKPCQGLASAAGIGLPTQLVDRKDFADKSAQEAALAAAIEATGADWILLAGYMAILSASFVDRFRDRIINIHPSLLPDLKGLDTHARALSAGYRRHGATVHLVTPALDDGPILLQAALTVSGDETESELAARVLTLEHRRRPERYCHLAVKLRGQPMGAHAILILISCRCYAITCSEFETWRGSLIT